MLKSLFTSALKLEVGGRGLTFNTLADFEFSLQSRTEVPSAKISELVRLSPAQLLTEATRIRKVEKHFVDVLARSIEEPGTIGALLREIDKKMFSQDHEWRGIVSALDRCGREFDEFKKVALVRYVQYLGARQEVLQSIYAHKRQQPEKEPEHEGAGGEAALRETVIFDLSDSAPEAEPRPFERLPKGETVQLRLPEAGDMDIMLSHNHFRLVGGDHFYLVDEKGADYLLGPGRNVIGRDLRNEVVIDAGYRDVSRVHAIVEPLDARTARVTDLSSHGTFVPPGSVHADVAAL